MNFALQSPQLKILGGYIQGGAKKTPTDVEYHNLSEIKSNFVKLHRLIELTVLSIFMASFYVKCVFTGQIQCIISKDLFQI